MEEVVLNMGGTLRMYQKWDACACQLCTWILNIAGNMSYDRLILFQCVDHVCVCVSGNDATVLHSIMCSLAMHAHVHVMHL